MWHRMPEQQQQTGGGPPHGPGETFKVKVVSISGSLAIFQGMDDGKPVEITLRSEYSTKLAVGQNFSVDFRLLHGDPEK